MFGKMQLSKISPQLVNSSNNPPKYNIKINQDKKSKINDDDQNNNYDFKSTNTPKNFFLPCINPLNNASEYFDFTVRTNSVTSENIYSISDSPLATLQQDGKFKRKFSLSQKSNVIDTARSIETKVTSTPSVKNVTRNLISLTQSTEYCSTPFLPTSRPRIESLSKIEVNSLLNDTIVTPREEKISVFSPNSPYSLSFQKLMQINQKVDDTEGKKIQLSSETYYSEKQKEINDMLKLESLVNMQQHQKIFISKMKKLTERKNESFHLFMGEKEHFKIRCSGKNFPLKIIFHNQNIKFELYMSYKFYKPDHENYELFFKTPNIMIDFNDDYQINTLFFTLHALKDFSTNVSISFTHPKYRPITRVNHNNYVNGNNYGNLIVCQPIIPPTLGGNKSQKDDSGNKKPDTSQATNDAQELFFMTQRYNEDTNDEMQIEFDGFKGIIERNKEIAKNYSKFAYTQFIQKKSARHNERINKVLQRKQELDNLAKKFRQFKIVRPELKSIMKKIHEREDIAKKRMIELSKNWLLVLTAAVLIKAVRDRNEQARIANLFYTLKDDNAQRIQKYIRSYLYGDKIIPKDKINTWRIIITMTIGCGFLKKPIKKKAKHIMAKFFYSFVEPLKFKHAVVLHKLRIEYIQKKWRFYQEIFNHRIKALITHWDKCMIDILQHERKAQKFKWTDIIPLFSIEKKQKAAKIYVRKRMREYSLEYFQYIKFLRAKENEIQEFENIKQKKAANQEVEFGGSMNLDNLSSDEEKKEKKREKNDENIYNPNLDNHKQNNEDEKDFEPERRTKRCHTLPSKDNRHQEKTLIFKPYMQIDPDNPYAEHTQTKFEILSKLMVRKPQLSILPPYSEIKIMVEKMLEKIRKFEDLDLQIFCQF